jgi:hypothetical protein
MLDWIKDKIESLKFISRPLKIRSYTEVKKEGCYEGIMVFYSKMYNMNHDDIEKAIRLIGYMEFDRGHMGFSAFTCIKERFTRMQMFGEDGTGSGLGSFNFYDLLRKGYQQAQNPHRQYGQYNG